MNIICIHCLHLLDNTNTVSTSGFVLRDITNDETQTKKHTLSSISKKSHRDEDFVRIKRSKLAIVHTAIPATIVTHDVILPDIEYMPPSGSLQPSTAKDYLDIIPIEQDMTSLLYPPLVSGAILNDNDQDTETIHIQEYTKDFAIPFIGLDHERKDGDDPDIPSLWIE